MVTKVTVFETSQGRGRGFPHQWISTYCLMGGKSWGGEGCGGVWQCLILIAFQNCIPGFESMWATRCK